MPVSCHFRGCKAPLSRTVSGTISSELPLPFYLLQHPARKRSGPILTTPEPARALFNMEPPTGIATLSTTNNNATAIAIVTTASSSLFSCLILPEITPGVQVRLPNSPKGPMRSAGASFAGWMPLLSPNQQCQSTEG